MLPVGRQQERLLLPFARLVADRDRVGCAFQKRTYQVGQPLLFSFATHREIYRLSPCIRGFRPQCFDFSLLALEILFGLFSDLLNLCRGALLSCFGMLVEHLLISIERAVAANGVGDWHIRPDSLG